LYIQDVGGNVAPEFSNSQSEAATLVAVASGSNAAAPSKAPNAAQAKLQYRVIKTLRIAFSACALLICLAFFAAFLASSGVIDTKILLDSPVSFLFTSIVGPIAGAIEGVFKIRTVYAGWNFSFLAIGAVGMVLRQWLMIEVDKIERAAKRKTVVQVQVKSAALNMRSVAPPAPSRMTMLRDYTEARNYLSKDKKSLTFLSIDVVGSTKMKAGEDKLVIEHAFSEYKKFVTRILKNRNIWKVAWTPDGIMCAFHTLADGVGAGQDVLSGLPWFNQGVHHLKTGFNVRCGVNAGEVVFPDEKAMEEVSDEVVDVAGHMQKYAAHGALWVATDLLPQLPTGHGFRDLQDQQVDGHPVSEWRPLAAAQPDKAAAAAN
jgi:class 3 adenylate cyclase